MAHGETEISGYLCSGSAMGRGCNKLLLQPLRVILFYFIFASAYYISLGLLNFSSVVPFDLATGSWGVS